MKIVEVHTIKGRGLVATVDTIDVPVGALKVGVLVHQGDRAWKIVGVEMVCRGQGHSLGTIGLLLSGDGEPTTGEQLFL